MKIIFFPSLLLVLCTSVTFCQQREAKRLALVIGVKNYTHIPPLQNTLNDATSMSATLKEKGFQVVEVYDPESKRQMQESVVSYFRLLQENPNSVGMVFYAGHGMQVDGSNYLIPTSANPQIKADLEDQCLNMDYVMRAIEQAGNPLNIFVLDACRNNPFRGFYRSNEQGLSMVSTPKGSYIVYATKPGAVASDGTGSNGLFTSKLLKHLNAEGLNIEQVFKKVAADVALESGDKQRPWIASDYTGDFYFTPGSVSSTPLIVSSPTEDSRIKSKDNAPPTPENDFGYETTRGMAAVSIGDQLWANKNLNTDKFSDGAVIPEAKTEEEWRNAAKNGLPAWCYFNNDPSNGPRYGKLYNWYAVTDPRKLCPAGWHVPSDQEWSKLAETVSASSATKLKSVDGWTLARNGSDAYKFTAVPAASRSFKGEFSTLGEQANWWSSTEEGSNIYWAMYRNIGYKSSELFRNFIAKGSGLSVRCVKE